VNYRFPKSLRLRSRFDYKRISWHNTRHQGQFLIIEEKPNRRQESRLGITVTRKYGDAHLRNRFKRLVREAFRLSYPEIRRGVDIVVRPKLPYGQVTLKQVQAELLRFLQLPMEKSDEPSPAKGC
jgi:ribonuclease P protein component